MSADRLSLLDEDASPPAADRSRYRGDRHIRVLASAPVKLAAGNWPLVGVEDLRLIGPAHSAKTSTERGIHGVR